MSICVMKTLLFYFSGSRSVPEYGFDEVEGFHRLGTDGTYQLLLRHGVWKVHGGRGGIFVVCSRQMGWRTERILTMSVIIERAA